MLPTLYGLRLTDDLRWGLPYRPARTDRFFFTSNRSCRFLSFAPAAPAAAAGGAAAPLLPSSALPRGVTADGGGQGASRGPAAAGEEVDGVARAVRGLRRLCMVESVVELRGRCGLHCYRCVYAEDGWRKLAGRDAGERRSLCVGGRFPAHPFLCSPECWFLSTLRLLGISDRCCVAHTMS